jgi:hypothetical protein
MDPKPADSFDAFLLTQRQRFRCRLGTTEIRVRDRKHDLEQFDVEIRKQPGTSPCTGRPATGAAVRANFGTTFKSRHQNDDYDYES